MSRSGPKNRAKDRPKDGKKDPFEFRWDAEGERVAASLKKGAPPYVQRPCRRVTAPSLAALEERTRTMTETGIWIIIGIPYRRGRDGWTVWVGRTTTWERWGRAIQHTVGRPKGSSRQAS